MIVRMTDKSVPSGISNSYPAVRKHKGFLPMQSRETADGISANAGVTAASDTG